MKTVTLEGSDLRAMLPSHAGRDDDYEYVVFGETTYRSRNIRDLAQGLSVFALRLSQAIDEHDEFEMATAVERQPFMVPDIAGRDVR